MDQSAEKDELLERDAAWAAAASAGTDIELVLSFWTDDAVVFAPGLPPFVGKAALREYVNGSLQIPGFQINWTSDDVTLSPDKKLAYLFSRNSVKMNGPDGNAVTTKGRAVTIWRREPDGQWRCAVDIWNDGPGGKG